MTDELHDELAAALATLIEGCTARGKRGQPIGIRFPHREEIGQAQESLDSYRKAKEKAEPHD